MRALAYLRVSTDEQAESRAGIEAQERAIRAAISAKGWELVGTFTDDGVSGKVAPDERPALSQALHQLDAGGADVLVVAKVDRLGRSMVDVLRFVEQRARGARWGLCLLDVDVDTTTANGWVHLTLLAMLAEWERRVISERTAAALAARKAAGVRLGRPVVLPASTRQLVADLRAQGLSFQSVADRLNADGVPTATGAGQWYPATVAKVIKSLELDAEALAAAG